MMVKDIMDKYRISDEELLHLRAMYNGTTMHSSREHIEELPAATQGPVAHVESFSDKTHNRAMTLFLMLPSEELALLVL